MSATYEEACEYLKESGMTLAHQGWLSCRFITPTRIIGGSVRYEVWVNEHWEDKQDTPGPRAFIFPEIITDEGTVIEHERLTEATVQDLIMLVLAKEESIEQGGDKLN